MATVRPYGPTTPGMPNDGSLVGLVRGWANRDEQALPDQIIRDAIRYAVDKAYRHLRIPPMEHTVRYTQADLEAASIGQGNVYQSVTALAVPSDLIEFIQIRGTDDSGLTTRVFNEKSDIRSYWDRFQTHYDAGAFWSRQGDKILITPSIGQVASGYYGGFTSPESCVELYYYRRLPALDALFNVTANNFNGQGSAGQIMDQVDTPTDITTFLNTNGNGRLYFEQFYPINVENFDLGLLTPVLSGATGINGQLYFNSALVDYAVTAANWNDSGMTDGGGRLTWVRTGTDFTGTLWFDSIQEVNTEAIASGANFVRTPNVVAGGEAGVTRVDRIRNGVETTLTLSPGQASPPAGQYVLTLQTDGVVEVSFSDAEVGDLYVLFFNVAPASPTIETAFDTDDGTRTSFNFRGQLDLSQVVPGNVQASADPTSVFDQEVNFIGGVEITGAPAPGTNTAFNADTSPSTRTPFYFTGTSVPNWFKDENERIALYGALAEVFAYLQEDDQAGKYTQLMMKEIEELNEEDRLRDSSGGNVQVQYNARGLI